jgi:hypothetical protein
MLRRAGIVVLVFLVSEDLATATTIVIMRTTTGFVVGADSLARVEEVNGTRRAGQICKVGLLGPNQYVAVAGILEFLPSGLDTWRIIEKTAATGGPLPAKGAQIESELRAVLDATASWSAEPVRVQVALFGFEAERPVVLLSTYESQGDGAGKIASRTSTELLSDEVLLFGESTAAAALTKSRGRFNKEDPVAGVRELIQAQIQATPDSVGPPINILKIDAAGYTWAEEGHVCAARLP